MAQKWDLIWIHHYNLRILRYSKHRLNERMDE